MPPPVPEPDRSTTAVTVRRTRWTRLITAAVVALSLALLLVAPSFVNLYGMRVLSVIFMYAVLAQAINLIAGFTGYPAFGNVVFFGLGSYSTAIVMVKLGGSFSTGLIAAVIIPTLTALAVGPALLRLRGHYFAIATVGLNETVKAVVSNVSDLTGGGMGMSLPLPPWDVAVAANVFYYLLLAAMVASVLVGAWFKLSRLGRAALAIANDEVKAEGMGVRTTAVKSVAWAISAALTGFIGGVYAYWFSYVDPPGAFDMLIAVKSFVIFLLGGAATIFGSVVAAFFVEYASTILWSEFLDYHLGAFGLGIMLIVLYMPDGFMEFARRRKQMLLDIFSARRRGSSAPV